MSDPSVALAHAVAVVAAYVTRNSLPAADVPGLIQAVHDAFVQIDAPPAPEPVRPTPPIPIKKTVTPEYLISLEDGRRYKTLKRHLTTRGITPEQYREKWGLPADYPMVASAYASTRSEMAKRSGLGRKAR